ncbi:NAD(P)H-dependent oxidoreductase [Actinoplanes sp. NPDC048796]|uniref:FMN-dependent NADH-azoreductase n=1 Tax=Actinoplanes sp. NPDC048796 TaxID=3155640 RepID=UPI00340AFD5B
MTLFRLDASIRIDGSTSREIADIVEHEWLASHPGDKVVNRHVGAEPIPATAWGNAVAGGATEEAARTPEQREAIALARTLADELINADAILFAVPLYNYGVSQHFKTYVDLLLTAPNAFGQQFLKGKPVVLATVRGGAYGAGTPREGWDHSTPYLKRVIADMWGADLTIVEREFTLVGSNPALDQFTDAAAAMHAEALDAAREAGKALGALPNGL